MYRYSGVSEWRIDRANSIAYGSDGNLYAAGRSWYNNTRDDFTVISLTDLGVEPEKINKIILNTREKLKQLKKGGE